MQYVYANNTASDLQSIKCGVPQGSVLGPLLFVLYINDIVNSSSILKFILFADDTNLFHSSKSPDDLLKTVNCELNNICIWFKANKLSLNVDKTKFILFGKKGRNVNSRLFDVKMDNKNIERVSYTKFLGVYIDENLNWKEQVKDVSCKVSKCLGMMNKVKYCLTRPCLKMLYNSFILLQLMYCNIIWGGANNSTLQKLKIMQKRAVRIISHSPNRQSSKPIFKNLNILTLADLHRLQVLLFVYKVKNNLLPLACSHHVKMLDASNAESTHNLRNKSEFIEIPFKTKSRENYIGISGTKMWNSLPGNLKVLNSVFIFKREVANYFTAQY